MSPVASTKSFSNWELPASLNPAEKHTTPPVPSFARLRMDSTTSSAGMAKYTASGTIGKSSMDDTQGTPARLVRVGFTAIISPSNPRRRASSIAIMA